MRSRLEQLLGSLLYHNFFDTGLPTLRSWIKIGKFSVIWNPMLKNMKFQFIHVSRKDCIKDKYYT